MYTCSMSAQTLVRHVTENVILLLVAYPYLPTSQVLFTVLCLYSTAVFDMLHSTSSYIHPRMFAFDLYNTDTVLRAL